MTNTRRRRHLGAAKNAAMVQIWAELERRDWSDAQLGQELHEDRAAIARILYGDRKANRQQAVKLLDLLGTPLSAWDERCPAKQRRHRTPSVVFSAEEPVRKSA